MGTLHCALENGADLYVFYFARCYNYSDVIHSFDWKSAVEHDGGVQNA